MQKQLKNLFNILYIFFFIGEEMPFSNKKKAFK